MATTREGGVGGAREKDGTRGNASSNPQTKKPTTKPSTSSQRAVPSNLKPTPRSSSSRAPLRSNSSTATKKLATANRKPSADKHPSSSSPQTALYGLTNNIKPAPKRSFSTPSVASRLTTPFIKRSLSTRASPRSISVGPGKKAVKKTGPRTDTSVELHEKDPLDHMIGCDQDVPRMEEDEVQSLHDITDILGRDHQLGDPIIVMQELVTHSETTHCWGINDRVEEEEILVPKEQDDAQVVEDAPLESVESADGDAITGEVVMEEVEEKHMVVEVQGSTGEGNKEGDQQMKAEAEEVKIVKPSKQLTQSVSKKETQSYNDVIEETVSKLMENRRNRIRALVGAFETVISLDSK